MSLTFTKLFSSITESTVWMLPAHTRLVWITMLAMSDRNGLVFGSVPGLAHRARVSPQECRDALDTLMSPDPDSRTPDNEGRRVAQVDGGWELLNHAKYRAIQDAETVRESKRLYMQRERESGSFSSTVSTVEKEPLPLPLLLRSGSDPEKKRARKRRELWHVVPETWAMSEKTKAKTMSLLGRQFEIELEKFKDWEFTVAKSDPDRAWRNWARRSASGQMAPRGALAPRGGPERADNGWRPDQRHRGLLERLGRPSSELDQLAGEFIRTGAIGAMVGGQADKAFAEFIRGKVGAK